MAQTAAAPGLRGTILAVREVPAESPGPARIVLSSVGAPATDDSHVFEFIVRTGDGTIISVVQQQANNLHPGGQVSILRGAETRIAAPMSH
jgi:hypothetical protein